MDDTLILHVPTKDELWFRRDMLHSPEAMSYNANWDVSFPGYHRDTGCIDFPPSSEEPWFRDWIGQEPERYFAYVQRTADGAFVGDVAFHHTPDANWWDMEVLIHAPYRGIGYGVLALRLLLRHAFLDCGVSRLHNSFERNRGEGAALQTHLSAGFRQYAEEDGLIHLMLTRETYLSNNPTCQPAASR